MTDRQMHDELKSFVALCFEEHGESTLREIAAASRLSVTTVHRLFSGQYTTAVHFGTVQKLGAACGLRLEMTKRKAVLKLHRRMA